MSINSASPLLSFHAVLLVSLLAAASLVNRIAGSLIGGCIGLVGAAIFAVIVYKFDRSQKGMPGNPAHGMVKALYVLPGLLLGGGFGGYKVFQFVSADPEVFSYYIIGLASVFLVLGSVVFLIWLLAGMPKR